jgi:hypothetical protein
MKKMFKKFHIIGLLLALIFVNASCSKDDVAAAIVADPADAWVGTWQGDISYRDNQVGYTAKTNTSLTFTKKAAEVIILSSSSTAPEIVVVGNGFNYNGISYRMLNDKKSFSLSGSGNSSRYSNYSGVLYKK